RKRARRLAWAILFAWCIASVIFAVASIPIFHFLGSPLTYPLIHVAGNATAMGSSIAAFLGARLIVALIAAPLLYVLLVLLCNYFGPATRRLAIAVAAFGLLFATCDQIATSAAMATQWGDRDDRRMIDNPHWVLIRSCLTQLVGGERVNLDVRYPLRFGEDF